MPQLSFCCAAQPLADELDGIQDQRQLQPWCWGWEKVQFLRYHQECNPIKIIWGIVVSPSWPHDPMSMPCEALLWRALLDFPTKQLTQCAQRAALALWCSLTSWLDVEIVCKTPVTLKAGSRWETWHKRQRFFCLTAFQFCFPVLVSESLPIFTPLLASISYIP